MKGIDYVMMVFIVTGLVTLLSSVTLLILFSLI